MKRFILVRFMVKETRVGCTSAELHVTPFTPHASPTCHWCTHRSPRPTPSRSGDIACDPSTPIAPWAPWPTADGPTEARASEPTEVPSPALLASADGPWCIGSSTALAASSSDHTSRRRAVSLPLHAAPGSRFFPLLAGKSLLLGEELRAAAVGHRRLWCASACSIMLRSCSLPF